MYIGIYLILAPKTSNQKKISSTKTTNYGLNKLVLQVIEISL